MKPALTVTYLPGQLWRTNEVMDLEEAAECKALFKHRVLQIGHLPQGLSQRQLRDWKISFRMPSIFSPPPSRSPEVVGGETSRRQRKDRALGQVLLELLNWYLVVASLTDSWSITTAAEQSHQWDRETSRRLCAQRGFV